MTRKPITHEGYKLFHEGSLALSRLESNGMKIDVPYLEQAKKDLKQQIAQETEVIKRSKIYKHWRKKFGTKTNLASSQQLGTIVFDVCKLGESEKLEKSGAWKADKDVLEVIDHPFIKQYIHIRQLNKVLSTYVTGITRHITANGYLHPVFSLNIARSLRSSCSDPNLQNIPIRVEEIARIIRRAFIPRAANRHIVENDFSGAEVKVAGCVTHDERLLDYIADKSKDMHRDLACQLFFLNKNNVDKYVRGTAKGKFTFAQFYGNWYLACAKDIWREVIHLDLKTKKGTPLIKHLKRHGIECLGDCIQGNDAVPGTFEHHVKEVETDFWQSRFSQYNQWRIDFWNDFCEKGYFTTKSGFLIGGRLTRKQVINYPIQGPSFHCLLWCLIRLQKLLDKYRMKSVLVGQIHDSIIGDIVHSELEDYKELAHQVMAVDLQKAWPWLIVPMEVDAEVAPQGASWFEKGKAA